MSNTAQRIQLILAGWDGKTPIAGTINTGPISQGMATIAAEIDKMTAELLQKEQQLAAARDTIAANNAKSEAWEAEAEAQLAEARAEVERLTPGHDAWQYRQACEAWDAGRISAIQFADAYEKYDPRGRQRRAREAAKAETL